MIFTLIAAYRGKKAYEKHGLNFDLNPYKPSIGNPDDCWTFWYEAHRNEWYKDKFPLDLDGGSVRGW